MAEICPELGGNNMELMLKQTHCHNKDVLTFTPNKTLSCYIVKALYVNIGSLIALG